MALKSTISGKIRTIIHYSDDDSYLSLNRKDEYQKALETSNLGS